MNSLQLQLGSPTVCCAGRVRCALGQFGTEKWFTNITSSFAMYHPLNFAIATLNLVFWKIRNLCSMRFLLVFELILRIDLRCSGSWTVFLNYFLPIWKIPRKVIDCVLSYFWNIWAASDGIKEWIRNCLWYKSGFRWKMLNLKSHHPPVAPTFLWDNSAP